MRCITKPHAHYLLLAGFGLLLAAPVAYAQTSYMQHRANLRAEADHYFLFEADRKQVIDYKQDRVVRICTGESRHLVPLKVTYDGESTSLGSNECKRVEAKSVFLEPKDRLDPNFVIHAEVQTM